jgi:hypothetical protein
MSQLHLRSREKNCGSRPFQICRKMYGKALQKISKKMRYYIAAERGYVPGTQYFQDRKGTDTGCFKTAAKTLQNMITYAILKNKSL